MRAVTSSVASPAAMMVPASAKTRAWLPVAASRAVKP